jgi:hypothetical protein
MVSFTQNFATEMRTNIAKDESGRQRFHGAFTGGFSAGFNNTVGSEEGFKPQTFISSRNKRAEKKQQTARDFMDEEDGLLGGTLTAKKELDSFLPDNALKSAKAVADDEQDDENSRVVKRLLSNLVIEPTNTMGKKILGLMGWKPGMAIGPRVKKAEYLTIPIETKNVSSTGLQNGMVTFALREDKSVFDLFPQPKTDHTGIGFTKDFSLTGTIEDEEEEENNQLIGRGRERGGEGGDEEENNRYRVSDLFADPTNQKKKPRDSVTKNKKVAFSSFLGDEDEDIAYENPSLSSLAGYSKAIDLVDNNNSRNNNEVGRTTTKTSAAAPRSIHSYLESGSSSAVDGKDRLPCPSDNRPPLTGFHIAMKETQIIQPFYPQPKIPKDFLPRHRFISSSSGFSSSSSSSGGQQQIAATSVFDYLKPEDRIRVLGIARKVNPEAEKRLSTEVLQEMEKEKKQQELNERKEKESNSNNNSNSVFQLLNPKDRERVMQIAQRINPSQPPQSQSLPLQSLQSQQESLTMMTNKGRVTGGQGQGIALVDRRPMLIDSSVLNSSFAGLSESFKNRFTSSSSSSAALPLQKKEGGEGETEKKEPSFQSVDVTLLKEGLTTAEEFTQLLKEKQLKEEKEKEKEREEQNKEQNDKRKAHLPSSSSSSSVVSSNNKINRTTTLWVPSSLLCKRCRVIPSDQFGQSVSSSNNNKEQPDKQPAATIDPLFSRLFHSSSSSSEKPREQREKEEKELVAKAEKEKIENEKALQKLLQEFNLFDVYQTTEEKPSKAVFNSIFNESEEGIVDEENEEENNEQNEIKSMTRRGGEEQEEKEVLTRETEDEEEKKKEETNTTTKLPKFIPKSKRLQLTNPEKNKSSGLGIGIGIGFSSTEKKQLSQRTTTAPSSSSSVVHHEDKVGQEEPVEGEEESLEFQVLEVKKKTTGKPFLSFADEEEEAENGFSVPVSMKRKNQETTTETGEVNLKNHENKEEEKELDGKEVVFKKRRIAKPGGGAGGKKEREFSE